jgi:hypothetical protein
MNLKMEFIGRRGNGINHMSYPQIDHLKPGHFRLENVIFAAIGGALCTFIFTNIYYVSVNRNKDYIPEYYNGKVISANNNVWTTDNRRGQTPGSFAEGWITVERNSDGWKRKFEVDEEQYLNFTVGTGISINLDTGEMEKFSK